MAPATLVTPPVSVTHGEAGSSNHDNGSTDADDAPVILIDSATRKRSADRDAAGAALFAATAAHVAARKRQADTAAVAAAAAAAAAAAGSNNNNLLVGNSNSSNKRARHRRPARLKRSDSDLEDSDSLEDNEYDYESSFRHQDGNNNNVVYVPKHAASPVALSALTFTGCSSSSSSSSSSSDSGSDAVVEFVSAPRKSPSHLHNKRNPQAAAAAAPMPQFAAGMAAAAAAAAAARVNLGTADDPIDLLTSRRKRRYFACKQFIDIWDKVNDDIGMDTEVIEDHSFIRGANTAVSKRDSSEQGSAQYGRIFFPATHRVFKKVLRLRRSDVFVDFGSGIGNTVVQASYTFGCKSKGIEMVENRHSASLVYKIKLQELAELYARTKDEYQDKKPGKVILQRGRLESKASRRFLINPGEITKAFCNNYGGVFGYRSARPGLEDRYNIDDYVGALFALMEPGSILATMYKLQLGPSKQKVNAIRKLANLPASDNASFYDMEEVVLGQGRHVVSWAGTSNDHLIRLYVYTRVQQPDKAQCDDDDGMHNSTVFLCNNMKCDNALNSIPIPATKFYEYTPPRGKAKPIKRLVINTCTCGYTAKMDRMRKKVNYKH